MKTHAAFIEQPLAGVEPAGWLRQYLLRQRDGLTGRLAECGYPYSTPGWRSDRVRQDPDRPDRKASWWPYEQTGYWLDGMMRCACLLRDPSLLARARRYTAVVLRGQHADGYLGAKSLKTWYRWPHAVFFRALMADYAGGGDRRIPAALRRHYLSGTSDHTNEREVCNVEAIAWTYARTGDARLREEAVRVYEGYCRRFPGNETTVEQLLSARRPAGHGVTFNEIAKLGAVMYAITGNRRYLEAAVNGYRKLDRHSMMIDGVCSSSEFIKGAGALDTHETCDIADYTWSVGYLLLATGEAGYADRIERACLNAAPGAVTADFKALQYFSGANQVVVTGTSNHGHYHRGESWMAFQPNPRTQCCTGNVNRIMPNYAARMWLAAGDGDLAAALYGPGRITARVGRRRQEVTVIQETAYPFSEEIVFQIRSAHPVEFGLCLRIPGWCRRARILVNGRARDLECRPGSFTEVRRRFFPNDQVVLELPMDIRLSRWPGRGVGVERGPLVFALPVPGDWRPRQVLGRTTAEFPAWDAYPAGPWNYALALTPRTLGRAEIAGRAVTANPWTPEAAPVLMRVPARRVSGWKVERHSSILSGTSTSDDKAVRKLEGDFMFTPPLPEPATLAQRLGAEETVTLVPYGCTRLRLAIFPDGAKK